ncbi:restriction endonuclease fold toxin, partial [Streptomyces sp. NPDC006995]|uniref:restriction endonuclease fold toxin n=1 Tax=unclassified Streptomyces TaxID=2593676 RepID=UPI0033C838F9
AAATGCLFGMLGAGIGSKLAGARCLTPNSFTGDTPVVMADGSRKAIKDVKVGDEVLATDPVTGESGPRKVTALIEGSGKKQLVDISVESSDGSAGNIITATDGHPFWVADSQEWTEAGQLKPGQWLQTSAGTWAQITAVRAYSDIATVYNLTVDDLHTYYATAGATPVLVHNCGGMKASDRVRGLVRQGKVREAADAHYEDMVSARTGGTSQIINGREIDVVTSDALIQVKRTWSAVNKPKNFLGKSTRNQIKATLSSAEEMGVRAEFWFKYGVHRDVRSYIEGKGGIVRIGFGD